MPDHQTPLPGPAARKPAPKPLPDMRDPRTLAISQGQYADLTGTGWHTVNRAVKRGEIPHVRVGRRVLIPAAWVRQQLGITLADPDASTTHVSA